MYYQGIIKEMTTSNFSQTLSIFLVPFCRWNV